MIIYREKGDEITFSASNIAFIYVNNKTAVTSLPYTYTVSDANTIQIVPKTTFEVAGSGGSEFTIKDNTRYTTVNLQADVFGPYASVSWAVSLDSSYWFHGDSSTDKTSANGLSVSFTFGNYTSSKYTTGTRGFTIKATCTLLDGNTLTVTLNYQLSTRTSDDSECKWNTSSGSASN